MNCTKVMVVDDEPLAIQVLVNYINKIKHLEVVSTCRSAAEAFNVLKHQRVDLMFLDIQMPDISGLDFLKSLKNPPKVIFTTAYQDYAVESYELEAIDYLLKPIAFDRFLKAIDKLALGRNNMPGSRHTERLRNHTFVYLKSDNKVYKVKLSEINYVESLKDYILVHTTDSTILTYQSISNISKLLPAQRFLRVHRSYLIALDKIQFFNASQVGVAGEEIPIGRTYKEQALRILNEESHV